jgi:hypothetical protein
MGFVTGMILALVGAVFTLGKLQVAGGGSEEANSLANSVRTSPGVVMIVLGVALMISTIVVNHRIDVEDRPSFTRLIEGAAGLLEDSVGPKPDLPSYEELFPPEAGPAPGPTGG